MPTRSSDDVRHGQPVVTVDEQGWTVNTLRIYLLDTINERDRKAEQRAAATDRVISDLSQSIKEALNTAQAGTKDALATATSNTQQALATANENVKAVLGTIDQRFAAVNNQISQLQDNSARKTEIDQAMEFIKQAGEKAEQSNEKRFDAVNNYKAQFDKFALQSEVNVKIDSLADKFATLNAMVLANQSLLSGKSQGMSSIAQVIMTVVVGMSALATVGTFLFAFMHGGH